VPFAGVARARLRRLEIPAPSCRNRSVHAVFAASLIALGTALALRTWRGGALPRLRVDRALDDHLTPEQRAVLDLTLSLAIVALGIGAAAA
jgi:hypothetical protein